MLISSFRLLMLIQVRTAEPNTRTRGAQSTREKAKFEAWKVQQEKHVQELQKEKEAKRAEEARQAEAARKRRLQEQQRREEAQRTESVVRKKRQDAELHEAAQMRLHALETAVYEDLYEELMEAESACVAAKIQYTEAKRIWMEACDLQTQLGMKTELAQERCADSLKQVQIAEARRRAAEQEEETMRFAREQAEREGKEEEDEDSRHAAELAESIRKLEELQRVEEQDRLEGQRMAEDAAAEVQRKKIDAERLEAERSKRDKEERECLAREEKETAERRQVENLQRLYGQAAAKERARCLKRDKAFLAQTIWSERSALARYLSISIEFDSIRFSTEQPLTFESVPWPVLHAPRTISLDGIEWSAVEQFFGTVEVIVADPGEYKSLLEKTHRRFHPDKWRSRGIMNSVLDEHLRNKLEVAGNVVAQAVTPLWHRSKSKSKS